MFKLVDEIRSLEKFIYFDGVFNIGCVLFDIKTVARIENVKDISDINLIEKFNKLKIHHVIKSGYLYVSKNRKVLDNIEKIDYSGNNHKIFGDLLGFPNCCIESFIKNNGIHDKNFYSYLKKISKITNERKLSSYLNFIENKLIYHIPCSFDCENSIKIAKKTIKIYKLITGKDVNMNNITYIIFKDLSWINISSLSYGNLIGDNDALDKNLYVDYFKKGYKLDIKLDEIRFNLGQENHILKKDFIMLEFGSGTK